MRLLLSCLVSFIFVSIVYCSRNKFKSGNLPKISLSKSSFTDGTGRTLMFHGINSVYKGFPWYDAYILNETRLNYYNQWGFNFVRLGTMWTGIMPKEGQVNQTYINIMSKALNLLDSYGLYALLDMHQDVISTKFASYDGVPRWLIDKFPDSPEAYPWPFKHSPSGSNWAQGYLTMAVGRAFESVYQNASGALNSWGDFWATVAQSFGALNNVIGYELINEPWAGDIYSRPDLLLPGIAGRFNLMPAYNYLVSRIRAMDNNTLIFYEPVTWGAYGTGTGALGCGFDSTPQSDPQRSVLSYHYYCWVLTQNTSSDYPFWERLLCDDVVMSQIFKAVDNDLNRLGGAAFLTEFGVCAPDKNNKSINTVECEAVMTKAEANLQSWAYWDSIFFDDNGMVINSVVKAFARTYPRATAGTPLSLSFDVDSANFNYKYSLNNTVKAPTEIFIPTSVHYPNSFQVTTQPLMTTQFNKTSNILQISVPQGTTYPDGQVVDVSISQK